MIRTKARMRLCIALIILCLLFIWGNSALNAAASSAISDFFSKLLGLVPQDAPEGSHLLRKLAHFTEFAALGWLIIWLCGMLGKGGFSALQSALLFCMLTACADESIQLFRPGRSGSIRDVWIDTAGALAGAALLLLIHRLVQRKTD